MERLLGMNDVNVADSRHDIDLEQQPSHGGMPLVVDTVQAFERSGFGGGGNRNRPSDIQLEQCIQQTSAGGVPGGGVDEIDLCFVGGRGFGRQADHALLDDSREWGGIEERSAQVGEFERRLYGVESGRRRIGRVGPGRSVQQDQTNVEQQIDPGQFPGCRVITVQRSHIVFQAGGHLQHPAGYHRRST
ncbi:hypothetical protein D3C84_480090 [compost metagenome]